MPASSWTSGAIVQMRSEKGGRARTASRLPAITVAISIDVARRAAPMTVSDWTCLTVLLNAASTSWSGAVRPWSWALTIGQ